MNFKEIFAFVYPYKIAVLPKLSPDTHRGRLKFSEWAGNQGSLLNNVWFYNEVHFHLDRVANKQNLSFWATKNPYVLHEKVHHAPITTVWAAISSHGIKGPFFF